MSLNIKMISRFLFVGLWASSGLLHAEFSSDCTSLMGALVSAGKQQKIATQMLDPKAGKDETFLSQKAAPWIGHYFPFEKGGIAARWQDSGKAPAKLISEEVAASNRATTQKAVLAKLKTMSAAELNKLSPAEKMDIYLGNYEFPITLTELTQRGTRRKPAPQSWEGFCNGRCAAGMLTKEPSSAVKVKNADGIEVNFEPNDIKALITSSYFYVEKYAQMGVPNQVKTPTTKGRVDAGAFDIALRSFIGESERPFVVDIDPGDEIWNHLAVGYKRTLGNEALVSAASKEAPAGAKFEVDAKVTVYLINDVYNVARHNTPTIDMVKKDDYQAIISRNYPYKLYLNDKKEIVGGSWESARDYPDFAWFPEGRGTDDVQGANPHLSYDKVMELMKASASKTAAN